MHAMLLKFGNRFRRLLIWNGLTLIKFSPVTCSARNEGEEDEKGHTGGISVYGFSSCLLVPLLDFMCLT